MGREVKRVPLDFAHPMGQTWPGYLSPNWPKCPDCENGVTRSGAALERLVNLILLAGADSLTGRIHPYLQAAGIEDVGTTMHEVSTGLAGRAPHEFIGHDAIDRWAATKAILKAAGLPEDWTQCRTCQGHAIHPDSIAASEAWEGTDPPIGDGWQMWETVSEGSPISPVFKTPEELARWLADTGASSCGTRTASYDQWLSMIRQGWAPTMIGRGSTLVSGVEAATELAGDKDE